MQVLLFSRYGTLGASSRLRSYQYLLLLKHSGISVTCLPLFDNSYLTALYSGRKKNIAKILPAYLNRMRQIVLSARPDLVWIEKELFPWMPHWFETILAHRQIPFMVDYDDAIFHQYDLNIHHLQRRFLGQKIDRVMRNARLVTTGNRYLSRRAIQAGAGWVERIPTVIDLEKYPVKQIMPKKSFTIGWIGSPTTAVYLKRIEHSLADFCHRHNAGLVIIGAGKLKLSPDIPIKSIPWSEEGEVAQIAEFDVGIMPMPDTPWTRGKCGYKLIQYMACGKPVIASIVSAGLEIIKDGVSGFLVDSDTQWMDRLRILYADRQLASEMGKIGRRIVATRYCLQVTGPRLVALMRRAAKKIDDE